MNMMEASKTPLHSRFNSPNSPLLPQMVVCREGGIETLIQTLVQAGEREDITEPTVSSILFFLPLFFLLFYMPPCSKALSSVSSRVAKLSLIPLEFSLSLLL